MKKKIAMLFMFMSLLVTCAFAQEVRGCTTKRVIYEGDRSYSIRFSNKSSSSFYGWEITNHNSFTISVDISMFHQSGETPAKVVKTQSIILKPKESYIFKREEHCCTFVDCQDSELPITAYYIEYKAYKLQ